MKKLIFVLFIISAGIARGQQVVNLSAYDTITDCRTAIIDLDKVYSCYNDSATKLFARMDVQPGTKLKRVISTIYDTLQAYHIDDTLDFFFYHGVHTSQAATLDWIRSAGSEIAPGGGTFNDATGWNIGITGWTITGGQAVCDGTAGNNYLISDPVILTVGVTYKIIYTVTEYTSGNVMARCGGTGAVGQTVTSTGTFQDIIVATGTPFRFWGVAFNGKIDNVSVIKWPSMTLVNSPVFTAYEGFLTDGASSYMKTNYNPGTDAVHWYLNSASMGVYIRTNNIAHIKGLIGMNIPPNSYILIRTSSMRVVMNAAGDKDFAHGETIKGFTITTKADAVNVLYARNSGSYNFLVSASTSIPNNLNGVFIGCMNVAGIPNYYTNTQFSCEFGGGQLTDLQQQKLAYIINWGAAQYGKEIW